MRENRTYGSEGGGTETNRLSLPLAWPDENGVDGAMWGGIRIEELLRARVLVLFCTKPREGAQQL
jgi:hypothetical protein